MAGTLAPSGTPDTRAGRLRRHLRNPTWLTITVLVLLVLAVPAGVLGPRVVRRASKGFAHIQERKANPPIASAPGTWINPWLRDQAARMTNAVEPADWRAVSFQTGPCHPDNLSQLPKDKWSAAIMTACGRMNDIQMRYAGDCAATGECAIPAAAKVELQGVTDYLISEYADSGLVAPYRTQEQPAK